MLVLDTPAPALAEMERQVGLKQRQTFQAAWKAGVKMVFGTDAGVYPHGDNARQFAKTLFENSRQYHDETLEKHRGEAASIVFRAEGHASSLLGTAGGETAAFTQMLAQHRRSPGLVSQRILRETLDTVFSGVHSRTLLPAEEARPTLMLEPAPEFSR
jgi:hypothetical protein